MPLESSLPPNLTQIQMKRGSSSRPRRPAAMEKQRRDQMKQLYSELAAHLHLQPYERMPLPEFLDQATASLKQRKERVERLKARKEALENEVRGKSSTNVHNLQMVRVTETDSTLEANLVIVANNKKVELFQLLSVVEQSGAEVTSSSFATVGPRIYCTIYAQAFQTRLGFDASLIESRLMQLIS